MEKYPAHLSNAALLKECGTPFSSALYVDDLFITSSALLRLSALILLILTLHEEFCRPLLIVAKNFTVLKIISGSLELPVTMSKAVTWKYFSQNKAVLYH